MRSTEGDFKGVNSMTIGIGAVRAIRTYRVDQAQPETSNSQVRGLWTEPVQHQPVVIPNTLTCFSRVLIGRYMTVPTIISLYQVRHVCKWSHIGLPAVKDAGHAHTNAGLTAIRNRGCHYYISWAAKRRKAFSYRAGFSTSLGGARLH